MNRLLRLNSLRKKFTLVVTTLLLIIFIVDGYVVVSNNINETRGNLTQQAIAFTQLSTKPLAEAYDLYFSSGYLKFKEIYQDIAKLDNNINRMQFIDVNGKILFDSSKIKDYPNASSRLEQVIPSVLNDVRSDEAIYKLNPDNREEILEVYQPYFSDWGSHAFTIRYFVSYDEVSNNAARIIISGVFLILLFFFIAVVLIAGTVNRLILSPITKVSATAQSISRGKYGDRINIKTNDEIEKLADATNKMATTLEQNIIELKELDKLKDEFIDIAAHNLKIPLNHLKYNIKFLMKNLTTKIDKKGYELLKDIEINSNKLQLLSEDLINVTAIKQGKLQNSIFMPVDLSGILKEVIKETETTRKAKDQSLKTNLLPTAPILADSLKIKQAFLNIVDNSIKYTPNKGSLTINLKEHEDSYLIEFQDTGPGITADELPKLFNKFYRAPSSAKYDNEGTGLGLYTAQLIIDVHHGKITAKSQINKGSTFSIYLLKEDVFKKNYPFK